MSQLGSRKLNKVVGVTWRLSEQGIPVALFLRVRPRSQRVYRVKIRENKRAKQLDGATA
jgi:hypothetical protein